MFLPALYPDRKVFHISEVLGFGRIAGRYFLCTGRPELAESHLKLMEQLEPDHPATEDLRQVLAPESREQIDRLAELGRMLKEMADELGRGSRRTGAGTKGGNQGFPRRSHRPERSGPCEEQLELPV